MPTAQTSKTSEADRIADALRPLVETLATGAAPDIARLAKQIEDHLLGAGTSAAGRRSRRA